MKEYPRCSHKPPRPRGGRRITGFALVVTLSLMTVLVLLGVGLLSLSAVSLRGSSLQALEREARDNARLSLMLALGELQRLAGPDQRITASSNLLDTAPETPRVDGVAHPHLTGVWKSWKQEPLTETLDYEARKRDDFLGWLVSAPDRRLTGQRDFATTAATATAVALVGEGVSRDPADHLRAEPLSLRLGNSQGRLAWAVLDQGQKAMVALPDVPDAGLADELAALTAPALPAFSGTASRHWDPLAAAGEQRPKLITQGEFRLGGLPREERTFHDLTAASLGLPVDVTAGRFATDLSLLFDAANLPADFSRRFLYSDSATPLVPPPARFRGAYPLPSPDPAWRLLHSHARMHTTLTNPTRTPTARLVADPRPLPGTPTATLLTDPAFTRQQLVPVISRAQFVFSIGFAASPDQAQGRKAPGQQGEEFWICWLVVDPVVTLWNPYNVNLTFTDGMIELYRVPLAYQFFRNGVSFAPPTLFANSYLPAEFATRATRYYRLNLKPKNGQSSITLKPGEHLVFTAHSHVKHYQEAYYKVGVDLRPGWNEPAGEQSNGYVGGISTLNTFVNATGANSGSINGASARSLPVKVGDRITLKVSAAGADVDKFAETNNQEITAMLRYRINTGSTSPGSLPPLVGAIELDYGRQEAELLPSYDQRDLPTLIVPAGIPRNQQGDNYAGSAPPPATRYKEPFFLASLHLKTARDSRFPSRGWLHNSPTNLYSSAGLDQVEGFQHQQYELGWEPMTDWKSTPTIEIDARDRGFGGSGLYAQSGQNYAVFASLPLSPLLSLGQLSHAPLNAGGQLPLVAQVVANSTAHPLLGPAAVRATAAGGRTYLDHSWLANQALFDRCFFSGAGAPNRLISGKTEAAAEIIPAFLTGDRLLANPRMRPLPDPVSAKDPAALAKSPDNFRQFAASLGIAGAFNINSTSVAAWEAVLASLREQSPSAIQPATGSLGTGTGDGTLATRHVPPIGEALDTVGDPARREELAWGGYRRLSEKQIGELARQLVIQIKKRGPFQSQAEFVNRRLESGPLAVSGALQAAIDAAGLNTTALTAAGGTPVVPVANVVEPHPAARNGSTADGATAVLTQADLLTPLAPFVSARSDTFVIRAYGEARQGKAVARVWCEATVQRTPDFVNAATPRTTALTDMEPGSPEARFGRRFAIVAFRWLPPAEV
jgi:hypothetical protein